MANTLVDLFGTFVTMLVFLGGFVVMNRQHFLDRKKDVSVSQYDRSANALRKCITLAESIRIALWNLATSGYDPTMPMTEDTIGKLEKITSMRSEVFGESVFLPSGFQENRDKLFNKYDKFSRLLDAEVINLDEVKVANNQISEAINQWREKAFNWHENEWQRMQK